MLLFRVIKALYKNSRVDVPYVRIGPFVRGRRYPIMNAHQPCPNAMFAARLVQDPKSPILNHISAPHTDHHYDGPSEDTMNKEIEHWGLDAEKLDLKSCEILNHWSLLSASTQTPLVIQSHYSASAKVTNRFERDDYGGIYRLTTYHPDDLYLYLSNMQPEDVLVFKQFSLRHEDRARLAHFGATHPDHPVVATELDFGKGARFSIEKRSLTFEIKNM